MRKLRSHGKVAVVKLAAAEERHDILIHLISFTPGPPLRTTVRAPAAWLMRIPYFATQLAEPWVDSSSPQQVHLECTPGSVPEDYLQCLGLLGSSRTRWPPLLSSVSKVLRILPVADHLLFKDCWVKCMSVLASSRWSVDEEDAIGTTISRLNMEPSHDVKERLDASHDGTAFEKLLDKMLGDPSLEASFYTWCEKHLNHSSAHVATAFHSILFKKMQDVSGGAELQREWCMVANSFLQFTDAQNFILYLVDTEGLLSKLGAALWAHSNRTFEQVVKIFRQVLEKVETRVVLLSNLQRARLAKHCPVVLPDMRLRLAETLPFSDATRMVALQWNSKVIPEWMDRVSHRLSKMDEAGLEAVCGR